VPEHEPPEQLVVPERVAVLPRGPVVTVFDEHLPPLHVPVVVLLAV
jgi:hypothetical protein